MKNLMLFISPKKDFLPEHKIATKIQIDNSLELGWKRQDLILATNFPYEYKGVKALQVPDSLFTPFCPTVSIINVIVELFDRKIIKSNELWWYHDHDAYQLHRITEVELDLGKADMALAYKGLKEKWDTGSIFFKSSSEDIFRYLKKIANDLKENEEYALMAIFTNNLLWITETETDARTKFVPLNEINPINLKGRIKTLNLRYLFGADHYPIYSIAKKPIKILHFHFTNDRLLDSAMYGKNSLEKVLMPKRLIKIFHKHGVKGVFQKHMKNLMICFKTDNNLPEEIELLIKRQIDHSISLSWKKKDIVLITNFPYQHYGVKAIVIDKPLGKVSDTVLYLLQNGLIKEAELWWYHDLNYFESHKISSIEIDLKGATAAFTTNKHNQINFGNFFFRKDSQKLFEWIRNRARRRSSEAEALKSLSDVNYRNINAMFTILKSS